MKYIATITPTGARVGTGRTLEIEIEESEIVRVGDQAFQTDLREIGDLDLYSLLVNNRSYEVHVDQTERHAYRIMVSGEGYEGFEVHIVDERTYRASLASGGLGGASGNSAIKAPIPGLVVKVLVNEGDPVTLGQSIIILEAMKMENELRAPRDGVVATVKVKPGNSVNQGETLVTLQ